jgi:hypothetical protein
MYCLSQGFGGVGFGQVLIEKMSVKIGTVFRFYFAEASKTKRSVVVALTHSSKEYATLLLINSELTDFAKNNPNIRKCQLLLGLEGREAYLEHDSFLNCAYMFTREVRDLEQMMRLNPDCVMGRMAEADIQAAKNLILHSGRFSQMELIDFGIVDEEDE